MKKDNNKKKVLVAMSGGVDSSVAAKILVDQGYEVAGIFLHFWKDEKLGDKADNRCCSLESLRDAKMVAAKIGIPLHTLDFSKAFKEEVVDNFLDEYASGRTPNPCVVCNKKIKTGGLLKYARKLGFDYLATGHYLKIKEKRGEYSLYKAKDSLKDQSYFLYTFSQNQLKHLLFPLGGYVKPEVRELAAKFNLEVESKAESQDICFLSGPHNDFLKRYLEFKPGPIKLLETGEEISQHQGLPLYTIGQRRGIEIGGTGPYYVAKFDWDNNILYVVQNWDEDSLYKDSLIVEDINWLSDVEPKFPFKCSAVIRYGHPAVRCVIEKMDGEYYVKFKDVQRAITPGQSIVFYRKDKVLGGGIIKK